MLMRSPMSQHQRRFVRYGHERDDARNNRCDQRGDRVHMEPAVERRGRESQGSKHQYELHDRGHDVHRNCSAATEVQRKNSATMLDTP
jgi:hypothetical protein